MWQLNMDADIASKVTNFMIVEEFATGISRRTLCLIHDSLLHWILWKNTLMNNVKKKRKKTLYIVMGLEPN